MTYRSLLKAGSFEELPGYWSICLLQHDSSGLWIGTLVWLSGRVLAVKGVWQIAAMIPQTLKVPVT